MNSIGRYQITREIGRGGMATVYLAHDPQFGRDVAIKALPPQFLHDPTFRARFEREARTIASLEDPAIVPVYDFGEQDGQPYLVMRYMAGGSLLDRLKQGPLTVWQVADVVSRIAPALDSAHRHGIVHRDLKPGNILFDSAGNPYVSDFGIVKLLEGSGTLTSTGIIGTPAYMSPEQVDGELTLDGRSDVYALGVILYELLAGKQPYAADTPMSLALMHLRKPVPHVRDVVGDLPEAVDRVVAIALAKDREQRFATVSTLAEALRAAAAGQMPASAPETVPWKPARAGSPSAGASRPQAQPAAGGPRRVWPWALLALLAVAAAAAFLLFAAIPPASPAAPAAQPTAANPLLVATATPESTRPRPTATRPPTRTPLPTAAPPAAAATRPRPTATRVPPRAAPSLVAVVDAPSAHMRSGPSIRYDPTGLYLRGTALLVLGRSENGDWLSVTAPDGASGWMISSLVQTGTDLTSLLVIQSPPTPTRALPTNAPVEPTPTATAESPTPSPSPTLPLLTPLPVITAIALPTATP